MKTGQVALFNILNSRISFYSCFSQWGFGWIHVAFRIKLQPHHRAYDLTLTYLSHLISHHHPGLLAYQTELFTVPRKLFMSAQSCPLDPLITNSVSHWPLWAVSPSLDQNTFTLHSHLHLCICHHYVNLSAFFSNCITWSLAKRKGSIHAFAWIKVTMKDDNTASPSEQIHGSNCV